MRGRGLIRLIQGISNGDPFAIGVVALVGVALVGWIIYKVRNGPNV